MELNVFEKCLVYKQESRNYLFNMGIRFVGISSAGCCQYFKDQRVFLVSNETSSSEQEWRSFLGSHNHWSINKVGSVSNNKCMLKTNSFMMCLCYIYIFKKSLKHYFSLVKHIIVQMINDSSTFFINFKSTLSCDFPQDIPRIDTSRNQNIT